MPPTEHFQNWALGYSGCDGGDLGSPSIPAIWVCGIEWGAPNEQEKLIEHVKNQIARDVSVPPSGYSRWQHNIEFPFNQKINKILATHAGYSIGDYKSFVQKEQPFTKGSRGYFKMNLFPMAFPDTKNSRWFEKLSELTGFSDKYEYLQWCRDNRIPKIAQWVKKHHPRLAICVGKTYFRDYRSAFRIQKGSWTVERIEGITIRWGVNDCGGLVVVIPFVTSSKGLKSNKQIEAVGCRIRDIENDI